MDVERVVNRTELHALRKNYLKEKKKSVNDLCRGCKMNSRIRRVLANSKNILELTFLSLNFITRLERDLTDLNKWRDDKRHQVKEACSFES